ncbi:MAG: type II toxin-antitoxin system RelE/ParE family toxin [Candidatus Liptonbacteria bacterium]|nr:type II toxin-antitoxin system RelE/ParE family toxin [Candidatus Liptonbacteria bacterium]
MRVHFKPAFLRDFQELPPDVRREVRLVCVETFPHLNNLRDLQTHSIKPLKGFRGYYRIRLGNYRIGFRMDDGTVIFMRVLDRRDIYRHFPG